VEFFCFWMNRPSGPCSRVILDVFIFEGIWGSFSMFLDVVLHVFYTSVLSLRSFDIFRH
jgi:hypothetical protein